MEHNDEHLPPVVEGRMPTPEDLDHKARNGQYYLGDVWRINREYPSAGNYDTPTNLPNLVNSLFGQIRDLGFEFVDASTRLNQVRNALELTREWAKLVNEARNKKRMFLVRRTPQNSGPMLMLQRLEHLRGQCSEWAPVAYVVLVRGDQIVVTRDRVLDQASTERVLVAMAKKKPPDPVEEPEEGRPLEKGVPNMPQEMFEKQIDAIDDLIGKMKVKEQNEREETKGKDEPVIVEVPAAAVA